MQFITRLAAAAIAVLAASAFVFYSWLAVAAPPPASAIAMQAPIGEADFAVTPVPVSQQGAVVVPVQAGSDWEPVANQLFDALALGLVTWIVWLVKPLILRAGDWFGQRAAAEELVTDDKMSALSKALSVQALDFALGRLGYTREDLRDVRIRNSALSLAAEFIHSQWPEIWKWVDQNKDGQIDWFESHVASALPPVDHTLRAAAPASPPAA